MAFTHDTEVALQALAALVNTAPGLADPDDGLTGPADVAALYDGFDYTGRRDGDDAEVAALHALRGRLLALWTAESEEAVVEAVNAMLREHRALPQLTCHDGWGWHVHAVEPDRPLADRIAVESALAVVDLVRTGDLGRLRRCAAEDCEAVLVDLSRNRSKRFCDVGNCGNRTHVAAYRARRASG